jgi:hypothetical protein
MTLFGIEVKPALFTTAHVEFKIKITYLIID